MQGEVYLTSPDAAYNRAMQLLRQMLNPTAEFRAGQWEAIEAVAAQRQRILVVQRTGWGKSLVYFLATKLLRDQGAGPTLLISPLLALMRNQIQAAERIGIRAYTINSANQDEWQTTIEALSQNACDVLLISPERLANDEFRREVLARLSQSVGLFVVDEAHCISDWGHDFRPDYRRIVRVLQSLPRNIPVIATTATANDRVVVDVQAQLGDNIHVLRGPLTRASLRLQNIRLADQSERLAWLVEQVPHLPGSGIIYTLTVADSNRVAQWLKQHDIQAEAYNADVADRTELEQALLNNRLKALVATVALGMGFDKPDLGFVIHFQRPGSVVHYYQQVGRAGRAVDDAYGILLSGCEDDDIQDYFIETAFPDVADMRQVVRTLEGSEGLTIYAILNRVNLTYSAVEKILKLLEVDGIIGSEKPKRGATVYFRTVNPWAPDIARAEAVTQQRRKEQAEMQAYVTHTGCLMEFLAQALDDPQAAPCGKCSNCRSEGLPINVSRDLVAQAVEFLKHAELEIEPRKRWPIGLYDKTTIAPESQAETGRALCAYGDAGWGQLVREGKYRHGHFDDALVQAAAELIRERWRPDPVPAWITAIPSRRHPRLVYDFVERLAQALRLPFIAVLERMQDVMEQKNMENSIMQARNVLNSLVVCRQPLSAPVLLIDDIVDSRWTFTAAAYLLRTHGSGPVYPFALASAARRDSST